MINVVMARQIILIAHNLRSCHNVGSLLRTAEGLAINMVFLTGYTPFPKSTKDKRLPYVADKIDKRINKTALGSQDLINWEHHEDIFPIIKQLKDRGYTIIALEQDTKSINIINYMAPDKIAIIVGREVKGIEKDILKSADSIVNIPMLGSKESFNVVQATAMALYHLRFIN